MSDALDKSIDTILKTRKGEKIHSPEFGCGIWERLDKPISQQMPLMIADIVQALKRHEERITSVSVQAQSDSEILSGCFSFIITYEEEGQTGESSFVFSK